MIKSLSAEKINRKDQIFMNLYKEMIIVEYGSESLMSVHWYMSEVVNPQ